MKGEGGGRRVYNKVFVDLTKHPFTIHPAKPHDRSCILVLQLFFFSIFVLEHDRPVPSRPCYKPQREKCFSNKKKTLPKKLTRERREYKKHTSISAAQFPIFASSISIMGTVGDENQTKTNKQKKSLQLAVTYHVSTAHA